MASVSVLWDDVFTGFDVEIRIISSEQTGKKNAAPIIKSWVKFAVENWQSANAVTA